jgi:hypothetical protein
VSAALSEDSLLERVIVAAAFSFAGLTSAWTAARMLVRTPYLLMSRYFAT